MWMFSLLLHLLGRVAGVDVDDDDDDVDDCERTVLPAGGRL